MNAFAAFFLYFAIAGVAHALPIERAFQDAVELYLELRMETAAKVQEIRSENSRLEVELDRKLLQLDAELKACPDFECADLVTHKKDDAKNEYNVKSRQQREQISKMEWSATSRAFDIAAGSFTYEASKALREDARLVVGFRQTPFQECDSPNFTPYLDLNSLGRCLESIIDFKSNQKFFRVKLNVGLGIDSTKPIPPPGRGEITVHPNDIFVALDELFSKSREGLLEDFIASIDAISERGTISRNVKTFEKPCISGSCTRFYFNSLQAMGFWVEVVKVIPVPSEAR